MKGRKNFSRGSHQLTALTQETIGFGNAQTELAHVELGNGSLLTKDFKNLQMQKTGPGRLFQMEMTAKMDLIFSDSLTQPGMGQLAILLPLDFVKQLRTLQFVQPVPTSPWATFGG